MDRLADRVAQCHVRLYLFVLMSNHFHLVFETPEANCAKFMQSLLTAYTVYYNLRHGRHGHLLDGRYRAKLVEGDKYLLALSRYVHLNPVRVEAMEHKPPEEQIHYLEHYPWSSFAGYIGRGPAMDFVDYGPMLGAMGGARRSQAKRYREFVLAGLTGADARVGDFGLASEDFKAVLKQSPRSIGSDAFRTWVDEAYQKQVAHYGRPEDAAFRKTTEPLPPASVLKILAAVFDVVPDEFRRRRRNSSLRAVAAHFLVRHAAMSQRDVARMLAIGSGSAVSKQLDRHAAAMGQDRALIERMKKAEARLIAWKREAVAKPLKTVKS